jgi:queuine tRNA-ribosyltransferase
MSPSRLQFRLDARCPDSRARAATFRTLHNEVQTPLFMPVGTQATVKAQLPETLEAAGSQILLANTYHLLLRPGTEVFKKLGGIHKFMRWNRSVLTDSGGYQIFSLPHSRAMSENGATFQSYVDGKTILLSPELSIRAQRSIGSDIMMVLDQCIPSTADENAARQAMEITHRWAARSQAARGDSPQSLFAIVQGALYPDLRRHSAESLTQMPFDGFAIGGLAVGEEKHQREDICDLTAELLPPDRPRYLMGVGTPLDLLEAVHRGVDMFDCIIPTQLAKRGSVFTSRGLIQLRRSVYKFSGDKLDPACDCPTCAQYSRAYLHHLTKTQEVLGWQLMGQHNLYFYHRLMREIRQSILENRFTELYREKREWLDLEDMDNPSVARALPPSPARALTLGEYEVHTAAAGFSSIRHRASGELMHSHTPPIEEARSLYVEQSQLAARLTETAAPLVIWDVGLGAAANAMAAIECFESHAVAGPVRPMQIVSFENDLDSLRLALRHKSKFPYLRHGAPEGLLARGTWASRRFPGLSWQLVQGNFQDSLTNDLPPPDLIFFDMFSSRTHGDEWTVTAFRKLFTACSHRCVEMFTYSTSTAVRTALLAAGFHVAKGRSAGVKQETTIALTPGYCVPCRYPLLNGAWLSKWHRSHAQFPEGMPESERSAFARLITEHPQFAES